MYTYNADKQKGKHAAKVGKLVITNETAQEDASNGDYVFNIRKASGGVYNFDLFTATGDVINNITSVEMNAALKTELLVICNKAIAIGLVGMMSDIGLYSIMYEPVAPINNATPDAVKANNTRQSAKRKALSNAARADRCKAKIAQLEKLMRSLGN